MSKLPVATLYGKTNAAAIGPVVRRVCMSKYECMVVSSQSQCSMREVFEKDTNRHPYGVGQIYATGYFCIRGTGMTSVGLLVLPHPASADNSSPKAKQCQIYEDVA